MGVLFEPVTIGGLRLRNRFIRSATHYGWYLVPMNG